MLYFLHDENSISLSMKSCVCCVLCLQYSLQRRIPSQDRLLRSDPHSFLFQFRWTCEIPHKAHMVSWRSAIIIIIKIQACHPQMCKENRIWISFMCENSFINWSRPIGRCFAPLEIVHRLHFFLAWWLVGWLAGSLQIICHPHPYSVTVRPD